MAVKTLDEFKAIFASGDFTPDSMLELAEDVADTLNDYIAKLAAAEETAAKVEKEWREKYTNRFFEGDSETEVEETEETEDPEDRAEHITINDLFAE